MKLITNKGQIALPDDYSLTIEKESPFFGDAGTASIPMTLPVSQDSFHKLGRPERLGSPVGFLRKFPAKLMAGAIHKDGVLVVDTVNSKEGITASLALDESDMYTSYKDKKLTEIFEGVVRNEQSNITNWVSYLLQCARGEVDDWFTIATVAVNKEENENVISYSFLNDVDVTSSDEFWPLLYKTRTIVENGESVSVPEGYGIAPFLYFGKFLGLLMQQMGYTLRNNPFETDAALKRLILLHNAADALCIGYIRMSDIVPSCTLSDFLEFINNKFHAQIFVYPEAKLADVVFFETIFNEDPDIDISHILDGSISITYPDAKQLSLEADVELEDSEPAEDTFHKYCEKYKSCKAVNEASFGGSGLYYVFRKALGRYYRVTYTSDGESEYEHLGTNNFNYFLNTLPAESIKAKDSSYGMISYIKDSSYRQRPIVAPYIGEKRHPNTSKNDSSENESSDQAIIVAWAAGKAESSADITAGYFLATNQKYNNLGTQFCEYALIYSELYSLFWKKYNSLLQNAAPSISGKFDYSAGQLISLRLDKQKFFCGLPLVMNSITYNVGKNLVCEDSKYTVIQALENPIEDTEPVIQEQAYKWIFTNNIDIVLQAWSDPQYEVVSWEFENEVIDYSATLIPPTELGQTTHHSEEPIIVTVNKTTSVETITETEVVELKCWYESVPL